MPGHDDAASWADRAKTIAGSIPGLDGYEVRVDIQVDRRHVRRDGTLRTSGHQYLGGVGIRAFVGSGSGYAFTNELTTEAVRSVALRAHRLAEAHDRRARHTVTADHAARRGRTIRYTPDIQGDPATADPLEVQALLARAEDSAREVAPDAVVQTAFGYKRSHHVLADDADGWLEENHLQSTLIAQVVERGEGGRTGDGTGWLGGERGLADYEDQGGPEAIGRRAATEAVESLQARAIPGGRYRTLCDPHMTGLMAHESFGHLTEYDLVASGWSVLQGRQGETLAADGVTIRDVPDMSQVLGRKAGVVVPYDQEGTVGRDVALLDDGVLTGYMHARDTATEADSDPTGNARALDVRHPPIVRMRNTYVEGGDMTVDEAVEALGTGVYLVGGRGGSPRADGSFMFTARHGYWVEGGEVRHPVKLASIYGNVLDFLSRIEGRTRDVEVSTTYFGGCGKWEQSFLHVGTGGPHTLVSEALIGGRDA